MKGGAIYFPLVQWQPVSSLTVRRWTQEANEAMQDCFESTDWHVLCVLHGEDINSMTDCIIEYIKICEHTTELREYKDSSRRKLEAKHKATAPYVSAPGS